MTEEKYIDTFIILMRERFGVNKAFVKMKLILYVKKSFNSGIDVNQAIDSIKEKFSLIERR